MRLTCPNCKRETLEDKAGIQSCHKCQHQVRLTPQQGFFQAKVLEVGKCECGAPECTGQKCLVQIQGGKNDGHREWHCTSTLSKKSPS